MNKIAHVLMLTVFALPCLGSSEIAWHQIKADLGFFHSDENLRSTIHYLKCVSSEVLRKELIEEYSSELGPSSMINFYILNRLIFEVPSSGSLTDYDCFSGFLFEEKHRGNPSHPVVFQDGEIEVAPISFRYFGPRYDAICEFDYFKKHFSMRFSKK